MLFLVFICIFICINKRFCILLQANQNIYTVMKVKNSRLEALKMLISSMELSSQEEVLKVLEKEGFKLTQATLSRDQLASYQQCGCQKTCELKSEC